MRPFPFVLVGLLDINVSVKFDQIWTMIPTGDLQLRPRAAAPLEGELHSVSRGFHVYEHRGLAEWGT